MNMAAEARVVAVTWRWRHRSFGISEYYPSRHVGIAEQHVVSMAAGMARATGRILRSIPRFCSGHTIRLCMTSVCRIAVCILSDHVGLVGDDGKTHHGVLSVPMLLTFPI
ncbi:MAG: hypothetical protein ACLVJB_09825 [Christensenellales bacterium]